MHNKLVQPERDSARYDSPALCPKCKDPNRKVIRRAAQYSCSCGHVGLPAAFLATASLVELRTGRSVSAQPPIQSLVVGSEERTVLRRAVHDVLKVKFAGDYGPIENRILAHNAGEGEV